MFNRNQHYNRRYNPRRFLLNLYIPVSHTNRQSIKHKIDVVMNHLVGMDLNELHCMKLDLYDLLALKREP